MRKIGQISSIVVSFVMVAMVFTVAVPVNVKAPSIIWHVDDDHPSPIEDGSIDHPFKTIQKGIIAANPGDTIRVYSGNYGPLNLYKNDLTIEGENKDNTIVGIYNFYGSEIYGSGNTITNLYFRGGHYWMLHAALSIGGSGNSITNCRFKGSSGDVIYDLWVEWHTYDNIISGNIFEGFYGTACFGNNHIVSGNTFFGHSGIWTATVQVNLDGHTISDNTFSLGDYPPPHSYGYSIWLDCAKSCTISNNVMNKPISIRGPLLEHWNTLSIDPLNLLNGAPIYYYKDTNGGTVPLDAGQVILANCNNFIVEDINFNSPTIPLGSGIMLGFSSNNVIQNNQIKDYISSYIYSGILLYASHFNTISGNSLNSGTIYLDGSNNNDINNNNGLSGLIKITGSSSNNVFYNTGSDMRIELTRTTDNNIVNGNDMTGHIVVAGGYNKVINNVLGGGDYRGIFVESGITHTLENNIISGYDTGIFLWGTDHVVTRNYISNNELGIHLKNTYNHQIYNNDFIGNNVQAYVEGGSGNIFNLPAPIGGNYWDDFDEESEGAVDNDGDGFFDNPYVFTGGKDDLPCVIPFSYTSSGSDVEINPDTNVSMTFDDIPEDGEGVTTVVTSETNPGEELVNFKFLGNFYNITTTATFNGIINISISYDDTGIPPAQEEKLKLKHWDGTAWIDITTYLDTENNIVYGETDSLSPFALGYDVTPVDIDIKPGSDPNSINLGSEGNIPVGILTTSDFDATTVDPETVILAGASVGLKGKSDKLMASIDDVDNDGDEDLMLHIDIEELDLVPGSTIAVLYGSTYDGTEIKGIDSVNIVPP